MSRSVRVRQHDERLRQYAREAATAAGHDPDEKVENAHGKLWPRWCEFHAMAVAQLGAKPPEPRVVRPIVAPTPPVTHTLCGWVIKGRDGDYNEALYLIDHRPQRDQYGHPVHETFEPLAKRVYSLSGWGRLPVSLNYHLTDEPFSPEQLTAMLVARMCGVSFAGELNAKYGHRYSELTGYLWTDETFKVGGHDVVAELSSHLGQWCHMTLVTNPL